MIAIIFSLAGCSYLYAAEKNKISDVTTTEATPNASGKSETNESTKSEKLAIESKLESVLIDAFEDYGNSIGNTLNGGLIAERDGWIFIGEQGLIKMREDGSERSYIYDGLGVDNISVLNEWVYFAVSFGGENRSICKIKTDGSSFQTLFESAMGVRTMYVIDEWIYFYSYDYDEGSNYNGIFRMDINGGKLTKLLGEYYNDERIDDHFIIYNERLYFSVPTIMKAYSIDVNGKIRVPNEIDSAVVYRLLGVSDDQLIYSDYSRRAIMRCSLDGSNPSYYVEDVYSSLPSFNLNNDSVYRVAKGMLVKHAVENQNDVKILSYNFDISNFCVGRNWLYYLSNETMQIYHDGYDAYVLKICRVNTDDPEKIEILNYE